MPQDVIRLVRAVGGMLAIIVLLSMVFLDFWVSGVTLSWKDVTLLLGIISGLLGVDMIGKRLPVKIVVGDDE